MEKHAWMARQVAVRLRTDLDLWVKRRAEEEQKTVSEFIRELIIQEARRSVVPCGCAPKRGPDAA